VAEPLPVKKERSPLEVALLFVAAFLVDGGLYRLGETLEDAVFRLYWEKGTSLFYALNAQELVQRLHSAYDLVLYLATPVALVAWMGRPLLERRRLRRKDDLDNLVIDGAGRVAAFARRRPVLVGRVLPWVLGSFWMIAGPISRLAYAAYLGLHVGRGLSTFWLELPQVIRDFGNPGYVAGSIAGVLGVVAAARFAVRRLTREEELPIEAPRRDELSDDKTSFAAVAVTPATQGAVAGLATLSVVIAVCTATLRFGAALAALVFAYILAALGSASLFRRVSRITVGIDGLLITGADRARFVGYGTLDGVEARGSDVLLKHGKRTALRLQLHDADVTRAPELAARLERAMAKVAHMRREGADQLMQVTKSERGASEKLASSARGGLDYRQPAMARDQLWQLVEGPVSDAGDRLIAAEALAHDLDTEERDRLRVAADRCAEPRARVALARVLERSDEDPEEEEAAPPVALRAKPLGG
jgi:hypothetical protein